MKRKQIPKQVRQEVHNKYGGHCAYCGCELDIKDMQVDHLESVNWCEQHNKECDYIENYMPSCRMCNYYKSEGTIEQFRERLSDMLMRNVRRPFDYRLALKYNLIIENVHPIKFYFETLNNPELA